MDMITVANKQVTETAIVEKVSRWSSIATEALTGNTLRAYKADTRIYAKYCEANALEALPAQPQTIIDFINFSADAGKSYATIKRRLSSIAKLHQVAEVQNPTTHSLVRLTLKGLARKLGTDNKQALPISQSDALQIKKRLGNSIIELRDYALLTVARDLLARSGELVSLRVEHIEYINRGALVALKRHKTHTKTNTYMIGKEATQALKKWLDAANITEGYIFQGLTKGPKVTGHHLITRDIRRIFKRLGQLVGIDDASGHSARVGMAQDLTAANATLPSIMQAGGWKSSEMPALYGERINAQRGAVAKFYNK